MIERRRDEEDDDDEEFIDAEEVRGSERARPKLLKWLKDILKDPDTRAGITITLSQLVTRQGEKPVDEFEHALDADPDQTIDAVLDRAEQDMIDGRMLSTVTYTVRADGVPGRWNFTLSKPVRVGTDDMYHRKHFATAEGQLGQQMEHNQALLDVNLRKEALVNTATAEANALLLQMNRDKDRRIKELEQERAMMLEQIDRALSRNLEREMMFDDHRQEQDRKNQYAAGFKKMAAPAFAALISGDPKAAMLAVAASAAEEGGFAPQLPGMPDGPTDADDIDQLFAEVEKAGNMDAIGQSFDAIGKAMTKEQVAVLMRIYARAMERREARIREAEAAQKEAEARAAEEEPGPAFGLTGAPSASSRLRSTTEPRASGGRSSRADAPKPRGRAKPGPGYYGGS